MAKISISEAAKRFDVSRPTLSKHLKEGKISGEKDDVKGWQIDTTELARVYQGRGGAGGNAEKAFTSNLSPVANDLQADLKAELERWRTSSAVFEALADERGKRLDQLVPLLMAPQKPKRSWWPFK